jgi:hypothetical protein
MMFLLFMCNDLLHIIKVTLIDLGMTTGYGLEDLGVRVGVQMGASIFTSMSSISVLRPIQPPIQWVFGGSFPWGKAAKA